MPSSTMRGMLPNFFDTSISTDPGYSQNEAAIAAANPNSRRSRRVLTGDVCRFLLGYPRRIQRSTFVIPPPGRLRRSFRGLQGGLFCVAVSKDGSRISAGSGYAGSQNEARVAVWDTKTGQLTRISSEPGYCAMSWPSAPTASRLPWGTGPTAGTVGGSQGLGCGVRNGDQGSPGPEAE